MKAFIFEPPKGKYYEVHKRVRKSGLAPDGDAVYVIVYTTKEEAEEYAKKVNGYVVEVRND